MRFFVREIKTPTVDFVHRPVGPQRSAEPGPTGAQGSAPAAAPADVVAYTTTRAREARGCLARDRAAYPARFRHDCPAASFMARRARRCSAATF
jgi:hypothetical protein